MCSSACQHVKRLAHHAHVAVVFLSPWPSADLCKALTCPSSPGDICSLNACNPATGRCEITPGTCSAEPSPSITHLVPVTRASFENAPNTGNFTFTPNPDFYDYPELGEINPWFAPYEYYADYSLDPPSVYFGALFEGQSLSSTPCPGAGEGQEGDPPAGALCFVAGEPSDPLWLNETYDDEANLIPPYTVTALADDASSPPVLVSAQALPDQELLEVRWSPISIFFTSPVVAFGVSCGFHPAG